MDSPSSPQVTPVAVAHPRVAPRYLFVSSVKARASLGTPISRLGPLAVAVSGSGNSSRASSAKAWGFSPTNSGWGLLGLQPRCVPASLLPCLLASDSNRHKVPSIVAVSHTKQTIRASLIDTRFRAFASSQIPKSCSATPHPELHYAAISCSIAKGGA